MPPDPVIPEVTVTVTPDGLSATLSIPVDLPAAATTVDALSDAIKQRGILINDERRLSLEELVCTIRPIREEPFEVVIATGRAPVPGEDGHFELDPALEEPDPSEKQVEPEEESEDIDYYAQSKLQIVLAKQRIGRLVPPTEAVDGEDVAGKTITAKPGKQCNIRPDATIRMESDGTLFAIESGILETVGDVLKIESELNINGYVDFSTGNVDFPGDLSVTKGVRDRFVVSSDKSIEIRELVEAASLKAGLDITLLRGAAGRGKGSVHAGRDLHTKYLDAVKGQVGRDAFINNELNECELCVGRAFDSPRCTIVGGSLMVGKSCEIEQLGGEGGVTTDIILGRHHGMEGRGRTLIELKERIEFELAKLNIKLKKLQRATQDEETDVATEIASTQQNLMMLDAKQRAISSSLVSAARRFVENEVWLIVHKDIYQGARVWIGQSCAEFRQDVKGPVKVSVDPKGVPQICEVETQACMPLSSVAKVSPDDRYVQWRSLLGSKPDEGDKQAA
jgi:uncharacterized protein